MAKVLEEAKKYLKKEIEDSRASISADALPDITADGTQMTELLRNLLANAIKFRNLDERPRIHISARPSGNELVFSMQDNGIGIETKFHERIFTIFQKLHTRDRYPGTGIGLAICKRIIERHGGRIWVESEKGKGSTFYFAVPYREEKAP